MSNFCCTCAYYETFTYRFIQGRNGPIYSSCGDTYSACCSGCNPNSSCAVNPNAVKNEIDDTSNEVRTVPNLSNSTLKMVNKKREIITKSLIQIKELAYWPISSNYALHYEGQLVQIFQPVGKKEINLLLLKMANWKISLAEKQNLYYNLISQSQNTNNLNLFYQIKNSFVKHGLGQVDGSILNSYIQRYLYNIISRILIYAEYGQELDNYDYTQLFNLGFQFINLNLNYIRTFLWTYISGFTLLNFGVDTRKGKIKQNPEITNSENSQEKRKCSNCN